MQTQRIEIDRNKARLLYREYRKHQHYQTPMDWEIKRCYQLLAQGRLVIKALESIPAAGLSEQGLPKLAISRADADECRCRIFHDGSARLWWGDDWIRSNETRRRFDFPSGSFYRTNRHEAVTLVPPVPLHLRPKRGLANYHILWEVEEWKRVPPVDPYLLRRIGKADLWLVVAMWDLTEVERAVLSSRVTAN